MDQQPHDVLPPLDLPKPQVDQLPGGSEQLDMSQSESTAAIALEQNTKPAFKPTVPPITAPAAPSPITAPKNNFTAVNMTGPSSSVTTTPAIADDADLIEKEWVDKAKEILEKTKEDPYLRNKEMNKIKADYMKKRYNKDIKISPE